MTDEEEIQPAPLVCPQCDHEFEYVDGQQYYSCGNCGRSIGNLPAQFAYSRGYDAFFAGQRLYIAIPPNRRTRISHAEQIRDSTKLFIESYSAIQEAFQSNLANSQREKAIEMMASISRMFMQNGLVSPLESNYWSTLMYEQVNRKELDDLRSKLGSPPTGLFNIVSRLRWGLRKRQLERALVNFNRRIDLLEQNIAFITPPHVRKLTSRKMGSNHV